MHITDEATALSYIRAWEREEPSPRRISRHLGYAATSQRYCAGLCGDRRPQARDAHLAAARVLDEAAMRWARAADEEDGVLDRLLAGRDPEE